MLRQATQVNGSSVYVYGKKRSAERKVALDFVFENLWFVLLENELWAVECLELVNGKFLIFDGSELIKVE